MTVQVPAHVPWLFHRVAVSRLYRASLREVCDEWSFQDVMDAHDVLDAFDAAGAET